MHSHTGGGDSPILFTVSPTGVATICLNRPGVLNAFTADMIVAWRKALSEVVSNREIRVLVVTGAGKAFCAGGDVAELESFGEMDALQRKNYLWENVHQIPLLLEQIDCPVIAAINGTARGAGLDMALMCDLRVMDPGAVVAESYIRMGLMPGDGGGWFLPRLVGMSKALEMLWTGDDVDAETALRLGLVNQLSAPGKALEHAVALAERIAKQPSQAIRYTKRSVYQNMNGGMTLRAHLDGLSSHMAVLEDLPEFKGKLSDFRNRKPKQSANK